MVPLRGRAGEVPESLPALFRSHRRDAPLPWPGHPPTWSHPETRYNPASNSPGPRAADTAHWAPGTIHLASVPSAEAVVSHISVSSGILGIGVYMLSPSQSCLKFSNFIDLLWESAFWVGSRVPPPFFCILDYRFLCQGLIICFPFLSFVLISLVLYGSSRGHGVETCTPLHFGHSGPWTPGPPAAASGFGQAAASLSFWQKHFLNFLIVFFCDPGVTYKCVFSFSTFGDFPEIFLQLISNLILSG